MCFPKYYTVLVGTAMKQREGGVAYAQEQAATGDRDRVFLVILRSFENMYVAMMSLKIGLIG